MKKPRHLLRALLLSVHTLMVLFTAAQGPIANYVTNGGFEQHYDCNSNHINKAKGWRSLDSTLGPATKYFNTCLGNVPFDNVVRYQWPKKGVAFGGGSFLCQQGCSNVINRGYFRNRLKGTLLSGKTYCVKFYYNVVNNTNYGIDSFGAYFGDDNLDTITKGFVRITYLNPQVQNQSSNFITDTLNWSLFTGTFTATDNEKHMVIGNFKSDTLTGKILINPTFSLYIFCDINIDQVSCIDIDLPAYAGPDTYFVPGDSLYIGRERDVGIDEACIWYKLPNTTIPIDTAAGLWVKPVTTSTYIVVQDICGYIKSDTVVVWLSGVGITELEAIQTNIHVYPIPSNESLTIHLSLDDLQKEFTKGEVLNNIGQVMKEVDLNFKNKLAIVDLKDLPNGVYQLVLKSVTLNTVSKQFVVAR